MRTFLSRFVGLCALSFALFLLAGCGGSHESNDNATPVVPVPVLPVEPPPPAPNPLRSFAYVTNAGEGTVSIFEVMESGALRPVGEVDAGTNVLSAAVHPSNRFAYAVNADAGTISAYTIEPTAGMLESMGSFATGTTPVQMRIHPSGRFAYIAHLGENFLMVYAIADDGQPVDPFIVEMEMAPTAVALSTSGAHLYVGSEGRIASYTVGSDGELTLLNSADTTPTVPADVVIAPSGRAVYVVSTLGGVSVHPIAPSGAVGEGTPVPAGATPHAMTIDPMGQFAYVANFGDQTVSMYTVDASNGNLAPTTPATVATGTQPGAVAFSPDGRFAYVTSQAGNDVHVFTVDRSSGVLTPTGTPVPAGNSAYGITIASFPR